MRTLILTAVLLATVFPGAAADFEIGRPAMEMRRMQICPQCREPLVVTGITAGAAVRCPKCKAVARRLPDRELLVKVYQVCPSCSARLDISGMEANAPLRCGACGLAQRALPEAIYRPHSRSGTGEIPPGPAVDAMPPPETAKETPLPAPRVPGLNVPAPAAPAPEVDVRPSRPLWDNLQNDTAPDLRRLPDDRPADAAPAEIPAALRFSVLVNGQAVSTAGLEPLLREHLTALRRRTGRGPAARELEELKQQITAELVEREILRQAAREAGFVPAAEAVRARLALAPASRTPAGVEAEIIREEMQRRHAGNPAPVSDAAVEEYFAAHRSDFLRRPRARLRTITVFKDRAGRSDRRPAEIIVAEIKEKLDFGIRFPAVAARYSEDVFRADGGLLRGGDGGDLVALDDLADCLQPAFARPHAGETVGPLQLLTGYAFCQVEKVEAAPEATLDGEREKIRALLTRLDREAAFDAWLEKLKKSAVVEYP